ncbi:MAG TPA: hypothetical protein PKO06_03100 [Candidatus Ozemobacteraceae bacterium]|nr:hypothetical protein [Candidatus Ozemobacteraceae bacterium]
MKLVFSMLIGLAFWFFPDVTTRLFYAYAIQSVSRPHESDAALIARFQQQRRSFETLRAMIASDTGLERVDDTWTSPKDPATIGITPQRIAEYRRLFNHIGTPRGIEAYDPTRSSFRLLASTQGITVSGSGKGYLWSTEPPSPLLSELDSALASHSKPFFGYRHLEDRWYLFLEID